MPMVHKGLFRFSTLFGEGIVATVVTVAIALSPAIASSEDAGRAGPTLELAAGLGMRQEFFGPDDHNYLGQPIHVSAAFGTFLSKELALQARFTFMGIAEVVGQADGIPGEGFSAHETLYQIFAGADAQVWLFPRWFVAAGAGVTYDVYDLGKAGAGFGLNLRTGHAFAVWDHHAILFTAEVTIGIYGTHATFTEALSLAWQWF